MARVWEDVVNQRAIMAGVLLTSIVTACSAGQAGPASPTDDGRATFEQPGSPVELSLVSEVADELNAAIAQAKQHDADSLRKAYAVSFDDELGYDPKAAQGLDTIQGSALALNEAELSLLGDSGFIISGREHFPSFPYAYAAIYVHDLPVFVSADMILEAVHRSYDDMLKALERAVLIPKVDALLRGMRDRLSAGDHELSAQAALDADLFLAVAYALLTNYTGTVAGANGDEVQQFVTAALGATGEQQMSLFGVKRRFDFSQFKPRGHYTESPELEQYFRAMMWMGRIDFRLVETEDTGEQVFRRRQLEAALGLRALMDGAGLDAWASVDRTISGFVGEHDYMTVPELDELLRDLGASDLAGLAEVADQTIAQRIIDKRYGAQRIASHVMRKLGGGTFPLNASFAFFGQRYVLDSHVFSNLVYDRVGEGSVPRVVPNPLDVAFAALKNDQAVSLLSQELDRFDYAGDLAAMRALAEGHGEDYWQRNLYTSWLGALQTLSANAQTGGPQADGLPSLARGELWGRRLMNTQLGSWAQLRHDTILYAKQSYTASNGCDFPDAYVEPYPEFFRAISAFADRGQALVDSLDFGGTSQTWLVEQASTYFASLSSISATLGEMAEAQRTGMPHSEAAITFIKQAIRVEGGGSGDPWQTGWYKDLFFDPTGGIEAAPVVADVHTDIGGPAPVPREASVLHVGTGYPRLMIMTVDSCQGPRAYAGAVFDYREHLARGLTRLDDDEWTSLLATEQAPPPASWLAPVLGP